MEVKMTQATSGDVVGAFGSMYLNNSTGRSSATADVLAAAVASKTIEVATRAMERQYDQFLEAFA